MQEAEVALLGRIVAEAAHDLNNVLAVTKNAGGLLRDIIYMLQPEQLPHADKFKRVVESLDRQTSKGTRTAKTLNSLAHLADAPEAEVDLATLVSMAVILETRHASQNCVELDSSLLESGISISGHPLRFLLALAACLRACVESAAQGNVSLQCQSEKGTAMVYFNLSSEMKEFAPYLTIFEELGLTFEKLKTGCVLRFPTARSK